MILLVGGGAGWFCFVCIGGGGMGVGEEMEAAGLGGGKPPPPHNLFKIKNKLDTTIKMLFYIYPQYFQNLFPIDAYSNVVYDTYMNKSKNKEYNNLLNELRIKHYELSKQSGKNHSERDLDVYKEMVHLFHQEKNRYPIALEFKHENLLPSSRLIQRKYGGLKKFRESMGLKVTDYTTGDIRKEKIKTIGKIAEDYENELYVLLYEKYHNPKKGIVVEREPVISGVDPENDVYGYKRADVSINNFNVSRGEQKNSTYIDFFYASSKESLFGCVNIKNKKIKGLIPLKDIVYVSVNPEFSQEDISSFTLPKNSPRVLSREEFMDEYLKS